MRRPVEPRLGPPPTKAHVSVARLPDYWYVACRSRDLRRRRPVAVTVLGTPLVLYRTEAGRAAALVDRCPHRNVPLSLGSVRGSCLQCKYHGWEFDVDGTCTAIPGLLGPVAARGRSATAYPVREQQGYVWVYGRPDAEPASEPFRLPHLDDPRYTHAHRVVQADATLHATIENALDVPHTAFLHKGLFRGAGARTSITARVRRFGDRCEAEYLGEPRPKGLVARLLSPGGGEVAHVDRFILPSIAQVDYALGDDTHIVVTSMCTPVTDFHTKLFACVSYRLGRVPGWAVKPVLEPLGRAIFAQDAKILRAQTDTIRTFGGEQFVHTDIDVLGPHIWRLMKAAERGDARPTPEPAVDESIRMTV
ncbi:MAG: aromatic ring-hydroxylating dioxygenase subunit alpha [Deltaproteobacteria bacterium]|nr:MAG: aromatic ring-hydroxylating dioxygenase subunit alpha [Deltaproteobacteria bacterium]